MWVSSKLIYRIPTLAVYMSVLRIPPLAVCRLVLISEFRMKILPTSGLFGEYCPSLIVLCLLNCHSLPDSDPFTLDRRGIAAHIHYSFEDFPTLEEAARTQKLKLLRYKLCYMIVMFCKIYFSRYFITFVNGIMLLKQCVIRQC